MKMHMIYNFSYATVDTYIICVRLAVDAAGGKDSSTDTNITVILAVVVSLIVVVIIIVFIIVVVVLCRRRGLQAFVAFVELNYSTFS